jgi:glycosyltransferase involved in cell wall biosynthesis
MKILYIKSGMHHKNHNAVINYKNIYFYISDNIEILNSIDLSQFDCVYIPCYPIDISKFPNTKFLFGPHFSVFPENNHMHLIRGKNVIYTQPSKWAAKVWQTNPICSNIRIEPLPFGVDTEKFKEEIPIKERNNIFIYFKTRNPTLLNTIKNFLQSKNLSFEIFNYDTKYDEQSFITFLKKSKFGVWIGRHESQGFALEEALSCNVPLLVWNVKSMNEEYGYNYPDIPATCIPYWDERCGEYFYNINELESTFNKLLTNIYTYKPRQYILENLSFNKCEEKLINLVNNI